jgi:methionine-rich copper-binding protein CopC
MASEVFLGPDGGPYVSVNENSGDLELKDNTGTVIANWDSGNSEWNFQNNPLSNIPDVELGPDGGPFVSINENNGDIELKDNSGNVVAFWDESNTQWDFQSNDLTNLASVEAGSLDTDKSRIKEMSGVLEKTSDQSTTSSSFTTVTWDNQNLDSIYNYDSGNSQIEVLEPGDYTIDIHFKIGDTAVGDVVIVKIVRSEGSDRASHKVVPEAKNDGVQLSVTAKDVSTNETFEIQYFTNSSNGHTVTGNAVESFTTITRDG